MNDLNRLDPTTPARKLKESSLNGHWFPYLFKHYYPTHIIYQPSTGLSNPRSSVGRALAF